MTTTDDPLRGVPTVEMRQMTFVQRRDLKSLVERVLEQKTGWTYDQRSVFAHMDTTVPRWSTTSDEGAVTMKSVLEVVMRPHLVGKQPRGLRLYHRYMRKKKETNLPQTKEKNTELERDGVVKTLNQEKEEHNLSTDWVCTVWNNSTLAKKLVELVETVSGNRLSSMRQEEQKMNERQVRSFRKSPF